MMTDKELAELQRRVDMAERNIAHTRGRVEAMRDHLVADPKFNDELRAVCWSRTKGHGMGYSYATDTVTNVPDGWPDNIDDPAEFVREYLDKRLRLDSDTPPTASDEPSSGVKAFRKLIGD